MSDYDKKSNSKLLVIALMIAAIAGLAYFFLSGKKDGTDISVTSATPVASTEATSEQPSDKGLTGTETPTETTNETAQNNLQPTTPTETTPSVVVDTKTLDLPAAKTPDIPVSEASTDPAVEKMMGLRKLGSDNAPIKIVEYASLTCGHCGAFHKDDLPKIKSEYIDTGKVQIIYKEFPLNKPAMDASKLLRCMPEDKFLAFQSMLFDTQDKWAYSPEYLSIIKQNAKLAGLADKEIDDCLNNKELENRLLGDMKAATDKYKISSTPTFIINDGTKTLVGHQPLATFKETFDGILGGATPASVAPTAAPVAPSAEEKKE